MALFQTASDQTNREGQALPLQAGGLRAATDPCFLSLIGDAGKAVFTPG